MGRLANEEDDDEVSTHASDNINSYQRASGSQRLFYKNDDEEILKARGETSIVSSEGGRTMALAMHT